MVRQGASNVKDNQKVKLEVVYQRYERYSSGPMTKAIIERDTLLEALKVMADHMNLYIAREDIEDEEMTAKDVLESIDGANGDGSDMIYSIKDLLSGETLLDGDDVGFDEVTW